MAYAIRIADEVEVSADVAYDWDKARAYYTLTGPITGTFVLTVLENPADSGDQQAEFAIGIRAGLQRRRHRALPKGPRRYFRRPKVGEIELYDTAEVRVVDAIPQFRLATGYQVYRPNDGTSGWAARPYPLVAELLRALAVHLATSDHFEALRIANARRQAHDALGETAERLGRARTELLAMERRFDDLTQCLDEPFTPPADAAVFIR